MTSSSTLPSKFIVLSYIKTNQELVLKIYHHLKNENLPIWINIQDEINNNIFESEDKMIDKISILVCFLTPMYQSSKLCQKQLESVKKHRIPIIICYLLPNWKPSGWLNKITNESLTVDLRGINQKNFIDKANKLRETINLALENRKTSELLSNSHVQESFKDMKDQSIVLDNADMFSFVEKLDSNHFKKKPIKYRLLPKNCLLSLSNLMVSNDEYILINANNHFHLFDGNLKLIRSNTDKKISENDLKDLCWCSYVNSFIILTKRQIYFLNPLTCKLSMIENMKLKDCREEFISCCCSEEKFYLITCQLNSNTFYFEEYNLPTFRFLRKFSIFDLIGTCLFVNNGLFNKSFDVQNIISIRYLQDKIAIIMEIHSNWFIYIFNLYEQPIFLTKIPLEEKSRITFLNPINQAIIFKDKLSNSFIQVSMEFNRNFQTNEITNYSKGFIDFNGKLRSIGLFRMSYVVILIDNALVMYKL